MSRAELKKVMYKFNSNANRLMQAAYGDYIDVLKKFVSCIDSIELIKSYTDLCGGYDSTIGETVKSIDSSYGGAYFNLGETEEEEVQSVYSIIKYISENYQDVPRGIIMPYSGSDKFVDKLKGFNERVVMVMIRHIETYLTGVGIDMGLDEKNEYNINVERGQVNISHDNSTINAVQNIETNVDELKKLIDAMRKNIDNNLSDENKETINDSIDVIEGELLSSQPNEKNVKTHFKLLKAIDSSVKFASACTALINFADKIHPFLSQIPF